MSCYEWEEGRWTLPAKDAAAMRKEMRVIAAERHKNVHACAKEIHRKLKTTSPTVYEKKLTRLGTPIAGITFSQSIQDAAVDVLWRNLYSNKTRTRVPSPTAAMVDNVCPRLNTTMKEYHLMVAGEGDISLEGRKLRYYSGENNHQLDYVAKDAVYVWLMRRLERVQWTRGTGGEVRGNNEYNEDEWGHQQGAYLSQTWGPLGRDALIQDYVSRGFSVSHAKKILKEADTARGSYRSGY